MVRVAGPAELADRRVMTVQAGLRSLALTHCGDRYDALANRCPHQGGPQMQAPSHEPPKEPSE